ncbi:MAG: translation initiation factor IF-2, partial [Bacteroidota bacterium]
GKTIRLSQAARKLNVGTATIVEHLAAKGFEVDNKPNTKIALEQFNMLVAAFSDAATDKEVAAELTIGQSYTEDSPPVTPPQEAAPTPKHETTVPTLSGITVLGKVALEDETPPPTPTPEPPAAEDPAATEAIQKISVEEQESLKGLTVLGKMELPRAAETKFRPVASSDASKDRKKRPRKRIAASEGNTKAKSTKDGVSEQEIQEQIRNTLAKLSSGKTSSTNRAKYRKEKRSALAEAQEEELQRAQKAAKTLQVTEFISANDLASLMGVAVNEVLSTCMSLGMMVSINQRLDAEAIAVVADEFGYNAEFIDAKYEDEEDEAPDAPEDLIPRAPIVTIMGHVDHGKTSLLDYIRNAKIAKGEAGGITQHIGAYDVVTESGKRVAFLDTPGHEAFTAMRARGAKITDIAIIVIAADDQVMPQTKEAISHAQAANVPIVIAINKIDKPQANPDKIKEALSGINILVEEWGGKYQSQAISAKTGQGIEELLEKVLLEAELLELQANPNKNARGTVVEASLDQGRGYVATTMVQAGTLRMGQVILAGAYYGKVKAMTDHRGQRVQEAPPATPVQVLGLNGAPQAGDAFRVMNTEKEARELATHRQQILREQGMRTKTHITLDEIGRRLAIGNFKELNIIIKGDVDGSIEALSDSLLKLSTEEIQVNVIHKSVGGISESDILLASAADAIVIGFQVRPSVNARKLAEKEGIDIRLYSIIYDAINNVKDAIQGMLAPTIEEITTGNATVKETFKITKIGTVAGCYVTDGYLKKANQIRLIRDGIV